MDKPKKKWYKRWWAITIWIFLGTVILIAIFGDSIDEAAEKQMVRTEQAQIDDANKVEPPKEISKNSAYYKCLAKAKECSEGIPAIQLEFMKACKDIYMYTSDSKELLDFTNGMC